MQADALQHVDQIGVRIDVVQFAGTDQALDDPNMFSPQFGPAEQPVFAPLEWGARPVPGGWCLVVRPDPPGTPSGSFPG